MSTSTNTTSDTTQRLMQAALEAASRGWPVFPLAPGTKKHPVLHGARRCRRTGPCRDGHLGWEERATTDPDRIRQCWATGPWNIGLATGPAGLLVVDLDVPKPGEKPPAEWAKQDATCGEDVLILLAEQAGQLPPFDTRTVRTARGGVHLYFAAPDTPLLRSTVGQLGWKVDTRGHGGYVVAAGSVTDHSGYEVTADVDPVPLPGWLVERLAPPPLPVQRPVEVNLGSGRRARFLDAAIAGETARVAEAPGGEHNRSLYLASVALGQLVAGGALAEEDVRRVLLNAAAGHIAGPCGCTQRQAEATITSGLRAGARRPRRLPDRGRAA
ncbi:hypothetical protein GCM10012275_55020 [Longimycelium tulufanense]|uniref:DNA primase/polymerase bifunctional N-terminal domain-containing protein n=1 Tax=Longimycelium tulufanense TaxID=907463 RepID=A0A8J3FX79_9PSEU|nr:bifunctional DNA primase/polymerase [Longimycelium tulufanense]GGM77354.1 hypothetical protein GCM10012275_55020 [Longimycelium tulufanense]